MQQTLHFTFHIVQNEKKRKPNRVEFHNKLFVGQISWDLLNGIQINPLAPEFYI